MLELLLYDEVILLKYVMYADEAVVCTAVRWWCTCGSYSNSRGLAVDTGDRVIKSVYDEGREERTDEVSL